MVGRYEIEVYNNRVHYFLTVQRNITILQGNSATGKTELLRLINENVLHGSSSGITVKCEAKCTVLTSEDWEERLAFMHGRIIFIDETASFLKSQKLAEMIRRSDNYFVIVTRDDLPQLPYSVEEIYGLKTVNDTSKYKVYKKVYNGMYRIYNLKNQEHIVPSVVITEDSNSGFDCFSILYSDRCLPAGGKSRVYGLIRQEQGANILVIVDGAAFGAEIAKVYRYITEYDRNCVLYAPESFEYLVLKSGIIDAPNDILEETFLYADSTEYMSWEEFYTSYLARKTQNTIFQYSKSKLKDIYKTEGSLKKLLQVLPEQIRPEEWQV